MKTKETSEESLENLNKPSHGGARDGAGRPKSEATIRTQAARDYISLQMKDSLAPIVAKAITQAIEGDKDARAWLSDRAWGKPVQPNVLEDEDGKTVPIPIIYVHRDNSNEEN